MERIPTFFAQHSHRRINLKRNQRKEPHMPFDKFVDMETLSEERRKALQETVQSMTVAELRKIVKELSDFEGDPWQEKFLRVVETHPQESFYRAVTQEGAIILYCPGEDTGVWFLPGSGMGPLPEEAKRHMKEAIAAPGSGRKQVRR
jgi:hypothetical protein